MIGEISFAKTFYPSKGCIMKVVGSNINITLKKIEIYDTVDTGFKFRCPKNIRGEIKQGSQSKVLMSLVRNNITTLHFLPGAEVEFWAVVVGAKRLERAKFEEDFIDQDYSGDQW